jgi:predicted AlkP superfamily pyrophosphatase or phosphodiesterase
MPCQHLIFISVPGLRTRDLSHMPRLTSMAASGATAELIPTFPCVTSPVQATMLTGKTPQEHGIIGNGFFHRDRGEVEMWVGRNGLIECPQIWDSLAKRGITSAAWMTQNIKDAAADFLVTPEPIHHPDGRMDLWCYSKPEGLYQKLHADLGHFPLMNYWGPMSNIKSSEWIVNAALWLIQRYRPRFNHVYLPHLDYAAQKFGPNSPQQQAACLEADNQIGRLIDGIESLKLPEVSLLIVSEYAMTDVSRVIHPNRILRDAGLATVRAATVRERRVSPDNKSVSEPEKECELLDLADSAAFAVVDHQFAHIYVRDKTDIDSVAGLFEGVEGIAAAAYGKQRADYHVDHPRAGEVVLICEPNTWLAYYWWKDDAKAPPFARTVDIHAKPGYDPVELFFDPTTKSIPLNASLVKGSHGAPAQSPEQYGVCVVGDKSLLNIAGPIRDLQIRSLIECAFA